VLIGQLYLIGAYTHKFWKKRKRSSINNWVWQEYFSHLKTPCI